MDQVDRGTSVPDCFNTVYEISLLSLLLQCPHFQMIQPFPHSASHTSCTLHHIPFFAHSLIGFRVYLLTNRQKQLQKWDKLPPQVQIKVNVTMRFNRRELKYEGGIKGCTYFCCLRLFPLYFTWIERMWDEAAEFQTNAASAILWSNILSCILWFLGWVLFVRYNPNPNPNPFIGFAKRHAPLFWKRKFGQWRHLSAVIVC